MVSYQPPRDTKIKDITIRSATINDLRELAEVSATSFRQAFSGILTAEHLDRRVREKFNEHVLIQEINDVNSNFWLAFVRGSLVGYARSVLEDSTEASLQAKKPLKLHKIYVLNEFQSRGIGARLLAEVLSDARKKRCDKIWLVTSARLDKAAHMYEKNGFVKVGEHSRVIEGSSYPMITLAKDVI